MGRLIEAWFDGCCEPKNPGGHAAYGYLIKVDGQVIAQGGEYVGEGPGMSNNVAEYSGVIKALQIVMDYQGVVIIRGDSKLVVNQLRGEWAVHGGLYKPYYERASKLWQLIRHRATIEWIPRTKNEECDVYSKKVLIDRGVEFRLQPMADGEVQKLRQMA